MTQEYEKTILRFVQDYCYKRNINNLVSEFALTIAPNLAKAIMSDSLTHTKFESICTSRKDFFIANDLDMKEKYDWREFPFEENIYKTIEDLKNS